MALHIFSFILLSALCEGSTLRLPGFQRWRGQGQTAGSPKYNYMFQNPLPIPPVAEPIYSAEVNGRTIQYYSTYIEKFQQQVYPELGPANLIGYNGTAPGPTFYIRKGDETIVRYLNNGERTASVHLHGSYTHSAWDGWAADELQIGQWKDYYYPNTETARTMWYHDHAEGHTAVDAYLGQAGTYIIYDPAEDALALPTGKYDVPLTLSDKIFQANGDLQLPSNSFNFFGDVIEVNEQPWPFLAVEPRRYRLRFINVALSRAFSLFIADEEGNWIQFAVIASDSGLFGSPVQTKDLTLAPGERYEVIFDFTGFAGQNLTVGNSMSQRQIQEFDDTDTVMRFVVGDSVSDNTNNNPVPETLNPNIQWPARRETVDHRFNFQMGGDAQWTVNGVSFNNVNNRILARPPQGTVELWEVRHTGGPSIHPVHIHLVNMQIISRTGGMRGVLPYEAAGLKDIAFLEPGETIHLLAYYGPWNGVFMFHCHNLIHEDNLMLVAMNVTLLEELGYDYNSTTQFADPLDPRFQPKYFDESDYTMGAIASMVEFYGSLNAYADPDKIKAAHNSYYATAGYNGDSVNGWTEPTATATAPIEDSGYGFPLTTATESLYVKRTGLAQAPRPIT